MSAENIVAEARMMCCATYGKSELDDIKLKECATCDLVRYCSDECKEDDRDRRQHETKCKERAAELRDEKLFMQPESSHRGDCPIICCLPHPLDLETSMMMNACCSKLICRGCSHASTEREVGENRQPTCPFCRHPTPKTQDEANVSFKKRVAANDPDALCVMGTEHFVKEDYVGALFEYWTKAAESGDALAHYELSCFHQNGKGVEKDEKKRLYHLVEAAIGGHPGARFQLAGYEGKNSRFDRMVKHFIIAANLGHDGSIQMLKGCYKHGLVSKEDFAAALRAHQAAVDATKSPQRDVAEAFAEKFRSYQQQTFGGNT